VHHRGEVEFSTYNFEAADVPMLFQLFDMYEKESIRLAQRELVLPAYDYCLKCSHTFNLLEARGAISVTERTQYIAGCEISPASPQRGISSSASPWASLFWEKHSVVDWDAECRRLSDRKEIEVSGSGFCGSANRCLSVKIGALIDLATSYRNDGFIRSPRMQGAQLKRGRRV